MQSKQNYNSIEWTDFVVAPWVGDDYGQSTLLGNKRILVVGHSTYISPEFEHLKADADKVRSWLIDDTEKARSGNRPSKFWTNIMKIVTDTDPNSWTVEEQQEFWDSIALYNFIQAIQQPGLHQAEDPDYDVAFDKFKTRLNRLEPTHILVFSADVFDSLAEQMDKGDVTEFSVDYENGSAKLLRLRHPSWPISRTKWAPVVKQFLE